MGKLTQKELLILVNAKVSSIDQRLSMYEKDHADLKLRMRELEVKFKIWAVIAGFVAGSVVSIAMKLI